MVEPAILLQPIQRAQRPTLSIGRPVYAAAHTGIDHKAGAHGARLQRHVHRAVAQAPSAQRFGGVAKSQKLRVGTRVLVEFAPIMRSRDHGAVPHDDRPDRNLAHSSRLLRLGKSLAHECLVDIQCLHSGSLPATSIGFDAIITNHGEMAERPKAAVLKTVGH